MICKRWEGLRAMAGGYLWGATVEFGDCDEAGIVFYPKYFYWFDCAFQGLLRRCGLSQRALRARFGAVTPIVDAGARFRAPASYDDVLAVAVAVELWEERRFRLRYEVRCGDRLVAEGHEVRAWAVLKPDGGIGGGAVPAGFRALLEP
jgi:4-hydroxybenzoyl-CoA thioesterase